MTRLLTALISAIMAYSVTSYAQKRGPGEGGGGGSGITINGKTELLDVYIFKKTHTNYQSPPSQKGITLPTTRALSELHLEKLTNEKLVVVQLALKKLEIWGNSAPFFIISLRNALTNAPIFYTDYVYGGKDKNYWIPPALLNQILPDSIKTLSFYAKNIGILIAKSDFESLDLFNQVALLIHEAIRHLQLQYGFSITNEKLQMITANVVFEIPYLPEDMQSV